MGKAVPSPSERVCAAQSAAGCSIVDFADQARRPVLFALPQPGVIWKGVPAELGQPWNVEADVRRVGVFLAGLCVAIVACKGGASPPPESAAAPDGPASVPRKSTIPAPATKPPDALASHNTNWADVVADVTVMRRKGNTVTAIIRLRKDTPQTAVVGFNLNDVYLLDAPRGKKYLVLKDEKDAFIASHTGTQGFGSDAPLTLWMKFPAPPSDVTTVTLVVPQMPPFEDLPIEG
jgi:hypothetical protein